MRPSSHLKATSRLLQSALEAQLRKGDGQDYQLQAWVLMPNHVHVVVDVWATPLSELLRLWKGASARGQPGAQA